MNGNQIPPDNSFYFKTSRVEKNPRNQSDFYQS